MIMICMVQIEEMFTLPSNSVQIVNLLGIKKKEFLNLNNHRNNKIKQSLKYNSQQIIYKFTKMNNLNFKSPQINNNFNNRLMLNLKKKLKNLWIFNIIKAMSNNFI